MAFQTLHIFFLPFLSPSHMLPMVDMAKRFAERGVKATFVTTPGNASRIRDYIDAGHHGNIHVLHVQFPSSVAGLPDGCDSLAAARTPDVSPDFLRALTMLRRPFEALLREHNPDCIISDTYYPWTADVASEFGIPRLIFHGTGAFSLSAMAMLLQSKAHLGVSSDAETFVVPGLPHRVEMTRSQLPDFLLSPPDNVQQMHISTLKSYGIIVNSFHELEPGYTTVTAAVKAWCIGPLSLCNKDAAVRGETSSRDNSDDDNGLMNWLEAQAPGSVIYVCFGTLCRFTKTQLQELASGLEASGHPFLWVLRGDKGGGEADQLLLLPEGFVERTRGKGLVVRGWAPQLLILDHQAVGGFLTHCGWNSALEGISAGLPMVTWPLFAEQFFTEKLIVHVLKVGVGVGAAVCSNDEERRGLVEGGRVAEAVARVMGGGDEAEAMRRRARYLAARAKEAVEDGGSSHNSLSDLIRELVGFPQQRHRVPEA